MMNSTRRRFLSGGISAGLVGGLGFPVGGRSFGQESGAGSSLRGKLEKTLKIGMVKTPGSLEDRFRVAKEAGFSGVELNSPGNEVEEVRRAVEATGLVVDGSVCAAHWQVRHSDPDESVRAEALRNLTGALRETAVVGGDTVLLVVGHGKDGTEQEVWDRSVANIRLALPVAEETGVTIAIENVWNHFCYDHEGKSDQTAEKFVRYVDAFESDFVGMQFDIGNHWKYGDTAAWIRELGTRIVKLDVKGFSREEGRFTGIGEGDIDFESVREALLSIHFEGWCAAEVAGGDKARLKEVSTRMDRAFQL